MGFFVSQVVDPEALTRNVVALLAARQVDAALAMLDEAVLIEVSGVGSWGKDDLVGLAETLAATDGLLVELMHASAKRNVCLSEWRVELPPFFRFEGVAAWTWSRDGRLTHASIEVRS